MKHIELSKELVDQIIFGMENQDDDFYLDLSTMSIIHQNQIDDSNDQIDPVSLPQWRSVDGFNLMERFVAALKNPLARETLHRILQSGRGVFRQFKNALKEFPEVEKLWYRYKDREMHRSVINWFQAVLESKGLERLKEDVFEEEDLILSDFTIRRMDAGDDFATVLEMDRRAFIEHFPDEAEAAYWYSFRRSHLPGPEEFDNGSYILGIYDPDDRLAGYLWALHDEISMDRIVAHILQVYSSPEFRGLGIATTLIEHYKEQAPEMHVKMISIENYTHASYLASMLEQRGFIEASRIFIAEV